jgi:hypothetical protein
MHGGQIAGRYFIDLGIILIIPGFCSYFYWKFVLICLPLYDFEKNCCHIADLPAAI